MEMEMGLGTDMEMKVGNRKQETGNNESKCNESVLTTIRMTVQLVFIQI